MGHLGTPAASLMFLEHTDQVSSGVSSGIFTVNGFGKCLGADFGEFHTGIYPVTQFFILYWKSTE
jgi:hypothetical protein